MPRRTSPTFAFDPGNEPPVAPEPGPTPVTPPPAPVPAPAPRPAVVPGTDIPNNLFSKIGFVLSNVAAGMQGRELPSTQMRQRMLQAKQLRIQTIQATTNAMAKGAAMMKSLPADQREDFAQRFGAQWESVQPGFADLFNNLVTTHDKQLEAVLQLAGENADLIEAASGGNIEEATKWLTDPTRKEILEKASDAKHMPVLAKKIPALMQTMREQWQNPEMQALFPLVPTDDQGRPVVTGMDLQRIGERFPKGHPFNFSQAELAAYNRNPDAFVSSGVRSPKIAEEGAKRDLFPKLTGTPTESGGKKFITFTDESGNVAKQVEVGDTTIDPGDLKAALLQRSLGPPVPEGSYAPSVVSAVNQLSPQEAGDKLITREQQVPVDVKTTAKEEAKQVVKTKVKLSGDKGNLADSSSLLKKVSAAEEGAFGVRGTVAEWASGWIGQASPEAANRFTKWATGGASAAELKKLRAELQTFVADNIKVVTGEESGRYTQAEQELTSRLVAALEPGASKETVKSAMTSLVMLQDLAIRNDEFFIGIDSFSLVDEATQDENIRKYDDHLKSLGIDSEADRQYMLESLWARQLELQEIRIGAGS